MIIEKNVTKLSLAESKCHFGRNVSSQGALNTWRGRLQQFLKLLSNNMNQKMIVMWFVHLLVKQQVSWVSLVWLKKCACLAFLRFKVVLAGNQFWVLLEVPNFVESWLQMSKTTSENLLLISQTTFELFKSDQKSLFTLNNQFYF